MRLVKLLSIFLVLVLAVVGIAFIPAVQRAAFLRALPGASVERFSLGLEGVEVERLGLKLEDNVSLSIQHLKMSGLSIAKLISGRIHADDLSVKGLEVDVPPYAAPNTLQHVAQTQNPFALNQPLVCAGIAGSPSPHELPVTLKTLSVDGRMKVGSQVASSFRATGGNFAPGASGHVDFDVDADLDLLSSLKAPQGDPLPLKSMHSKGRVLVAQSPRGRLGSVDKDQTLTLSPRDTTLPDEKLKIRSVVRLQEGKQAFDLDLEVIDLRQNTQKPFVTFKGVVSQDQTRGPFTFTFQSGQLRPLLESLKLPDLALSGSGNVDVSPKTGVHMQLKAQGQVAALGRLDPRLKPLPSMEFNLDTSATLLPEGIADIQALSFSAHDTAQTMDLELRALQLVSISLDKKLPVKAVGPAFSIHGQHVPVSWGQGFIAAQDIPLDLKSGLIDIQGEIQAQEAQWEVQAQTKLTSLSLDYEGIPKLQDLSWEGPLTAHYAMKGWDVQSIGWKAQSQGNLWAQGDLAVAQRETLTAQGSLEAWPRKLMGQPVAVEMQIDQWPQARLSGNFDVAAGEDTLKFNTLKFLVEQTPSQPWMQLEVKSGLVISLDDPYASLKGQDRIASGTFNGLPLSLFSPFIEGFAFSGKLERFSFECQSEGDSVFLKTPEPIRVNDLDIIHEGQPLIEDLDIELRPSLELGPKELFFDFGIIEFHKNDINLLQGKTSGRYNHQEGGLPVMQWEYLAQLPQLVDHTLLKKTLKTPASGTLAIEGILNQNLLIKLGLKDLKPKNGKGFIERLLLDIDAQYAPNDGWKTHVPIAMIGAGGGSNLDISGQLKKNRFELNVSGPQLVVDDLLFIASFLKEQDLTAPAPRNQNSSAPKPSESITDKQPFWFPYEGQALLDIKRVSLMSNALDALQGKMIVSPQALTLESIEAQQAGAPIKARAQVQFDAQHEEPYQLTSDFSLDKWNIGTMLRRTFPLDPPVIEGLFSVQATAKSHGRTLEDTLEQITGTCSISGGPGVVRGLAYAGSGAQAGATVGGLALKVLGNATDKPGLTALSRISGYFDELPYETLQCTLEREADQDIILNVLSLDGPVAGVRGQGSVSYHPHRPFMNQPLALRFDLGAKGALAEDLQAISLASERPGEGGYYWTTQAFEISGTPAKPNTDKLWGIVRKAAIGAFAKQKTKAPNQKLKERPVEKAQNAIEGLFRGLF